MNRRNFFKAASAVMLGGLIGAPAQEPAIEYEWHIDDGAAITDDGLRQIPDLLYCHTSKTANIKDLVAQAIADTLQELSA